MPRDLPASGPNHHPQAIFCNCSELQELATTIAQPRIRTFWFVLSLQHAARRFRLAAWLGRQYDALHDWIFIPFIEGIKLQPCELCTAAFLEDDDLAAVPDQPTLVHDAREREHSAIAIHGRGPVLVPIGTTGRVADGTDGGA